MRGMVSEKLMMWFVQGCSALGQGVAVRGPTAQAESKRPFDFRWTHNDPMTSFPRQLIKNNSARSVFACFRINQIFSIFIILLNFTLWNNVISYWACGSVVERPLCI